MYNPSKRTGLGIKQILSQDTVIYTSYTSFKVSDSLKLHHLHLLAPVERLFSKAGIILNQGCSTHIVESMPFHCFEPLLTVFLK